jgi:hypothetical protein
MAAISSGFWLSAKCPVSAIDEGHVRSCGEHLPLVGRDGDVVVFAEYDPGPGSRVAESLGERAMSVEVGEVQTGLRAQKARSLFLSSFDRNSRRAGGKLLFIAGPMIFSVSD